MTGRARRLRPWRTILVLTVVWVLFWGDLSLANVLSGAILGLGIVLVFPLPPVAFTGRLRPLGLARLVGALLVDLVRASIRIAVRAVAPGPMRNAIIRVELRTRSDLYLTLTAQLVSVVPGSNVVDIRREESLMYLHVLDVRSPADLDRARRDARVAEARVLRAFGSDDEVAELNAEPVISS